MKSASLTLKRRCQRCGILVAGNGSCRRCQPEGGTLRHQPTPREEDAVMSKVARYAFGDWSKDCKPSTDVNQKAHVKPRDRSARRMAVTTDAQIASRRLKRRTISEPGASSHSGKPVLSFPPIVDLSDTGASLRAGERSGLAVAHPQRASEFESTLEVFFDADRVDRLTDMELRAVKRRRWPLIIGLATVLLITVGGMALVFV